MNDWITLDKQAFNVYIDFKNKTFKDCTTFLQIRDFIIFFTIAKLSVSKQIDNWRLFVYIQCKLWQAVKAL